MTTIEAKVPDYLARLAREAAEKEHVTVDQIVALALASQVSAWRVRDDMAARAARGNVTDFDRILASVPDVTPMPGDELPTGYLSPLPKACPSAQHGRPAAASSRASLTAKPTITVTTSRRIPSTCMTGRRQFSISSASITSA